MWKRVLWTQLVPKVLTAMLRPFEFPQSGARWVSSSSETCPNPRAELCPRRCWWHSALNNEPTEKTRHPRDPSSSSPTVWSLKHRESITSMTHLGKSQYRDNSNHNNSNIQHCSSIQTFALFDMMLDKTHIKKKKWCTLATHNSFYTTCSVEFLNLIDH